MPSMSGPSRTRSAGHTTNESDLQRGQACVDCRRRKMRCDGQRPVCGPCVRADRIEDCEYVEQGRSRVEILQEDISRIESRIYELEHPAKAAGGSVFLCHPYKHPQRRSHMPPLAQVFESPTRGSPSPNGWWNSPEPPVDMIQMLLDVFIPYASDWGFFLDTSRFRRESLLPHPIGHASRPTPALLSAVYLVGIALSDAPTLREHEKKFLSRALSSLPVSLSGIHPRRCIHALQAEILLSNYLYSSGRFLEARYHTSTAASLAVSTVLLSPSAATARPDAEAIDEGERRDAFWTTLVLDRSWAVMLATYPDMQDTDETLQFPWPESPDRPLSTMSQFLEGTEPPNTPMSPKTIVAKAAVLWERANCLVVHWQPESEQLQSSFASLDDRITNFQCKMPFPNPAPQTLSDLRTLIVGHGMAHAATIQLHGIFAHTSPESKQKCLVAAKTILGLTAEADLLESAFVHPIFSVCTSSFIPGSLTKISLQTIWAAACSVAVEEIAALRAARRARGHDVPSATERALVEVFDTAINAMRRLSTWLNPLLKECQFSRIEGASAQWA
ncbi:hypothetical protein C8R47DRAFT_525554 [Mycena vitilis]|nr:hypothetical protein C8R47DRAFT_525554 [Mycena vitilis]